MTEFALLLPILLVLLFGVFEGALLMFSNGSARFAASEAARVVAQAGTRTSADTDAVAYVRGNTALGTTNIARVTSIDVYRVVIRNGALQRDSSTTCGTPATHACVNSYRADGSVIGSATADWDPSTRNVSASSGDYIGVDVHYQYDWKNGIFSSLFGSGVTGVATVWARLEPVVY